MPFTKNLNLKDINPEWSEKRSGYRKLDEVPIRFVPVVSSYDAEPDNSYSFSLSLNLSSTPEVKITKSVNKSGEEVTEKEYKKDGQVKQVIKKLCSGNAEAYLKWKIQLDHVIKNRPCESSKAKLDMAEAMLYGDLLESWKLWRKSEAEKEVEKSFKDKDDKKYKKKVKQGENSDTYKYCVGKTRQKFIKKYDARKQKAYMRSSLLKPKSLSVDGMSSRLKILNSYLSSFPSPDNTSFSEGEMIEIVLNMLPAVWVNSMTTAGLEPREKSYEDLIEHLEKLESSLPEESIPRKDKKKDTPAETTSILKKAKVDKSTKVAFGKGAREKSQKACELCKVMKGVDNPAWKTHNTSECRSKEYYKKRMASTSRDEPDPKKKKYKGAMSNYAIKKGIKKEIKKTLARRDAGYISSSDSESD